MLIQSKINQLDSMYPSTGCMMDATSYGSLPEYSKWGSIYGYSFGNSSIELDGQLYALTKGQYFSLFLGNNLPNIKCDDKLFLVTRLGYKCQNSMGWVEKQGRLSYIDGCTDSLLIYPPRQGDPSLNLLHFPPGIEQSRHLHPSIRIGCVIAGEGISDAWVNGQVESVPLVPGVAFCLEENELHRFRTENSSMTVIAWHPDGDWGPTDHNHTMLNRTYLK
jgi:quercetin dioxygenase-like cupin family protein